MKINQKGFSAVEIILVIIVVGLLGTLGWVFFSKTQESKDASTDSSKQNTNKSRDVCSDGSTSAEKGTFCAKDIGISLPVPDAFKGKIEKIENYTIYTQSTIAEEPKVFGVSDVAYEATLKGPDDQYSLTIAKESLRNFRVKSYVPALFNENTKQVHYDSQFSDGREVESVTLDGVKFYNYGIGDAGVVTSIYTAVMNDKLIVVSLDTRQTPGDPATQKYILDSSVLLKQFKDRVKSLKVV